MTEINIKAKVTCNPDSGNYFLRFSEAPHDRVRANEFLYHLEEAYATLSSSNDEYFGSAVLEAGDLLELNLKITHK